MLFLVFSGYFFNRFPMTWDYESLPKFFRIFWKMRKNQCLKSNDFVREKLIRKWGWVTFFGINSSWSILLYLAGNLFLNWNLKKLKIVFGAKYENWTSNISLTNKNQNWKLKSIFVFVRYCLINICLCVGNLSFKSTLRVDLNKSKWWGNLLCNFF